MPCTQIKALSEEMQHVENFIKHLAQHPKPSVEDIQLAEGILTYMCVNKVLCLNEVYDIMMDNMGALKNSSCTENDSVYVLKCALSLNVIQRIKIWQESTVRQAAA